ncbi:translation elongation factor Ts [Yunchengibacter salinarum]|uniref:translation elongation factor Ts n=1 Tax=Yunchengibacter salinarum TaxID=3133399 RepID=UPI0035B5A456
MAQITAKLVKDLREKSGAGMMDCKKALAENDGDMDGALDWLRTKGLSAAAKKSGRVAVEGLVGLFAEGPKAAVVEVNSETDFVARNKQFQDFVEGVARVAHAAGEDMDAVAEAAFPGSDKAVKDVLTDNIATIGENMTLRRARVLAVENGFIGSYIHNNVTDTTGKIVALVALESDAGEDVLAPLGKQLAMHVAAANPASLDVDDLDQDLVEREKEVQRQKARESGKPENIIEKMIEGRMRKFYEEVSLLKQTFVIDGETPVEKVVSQAAEKAGTDIKVTGFVRLELGEGLEKKEEDFAAEVAAAAGS